MILRHGLALNVWRRRGFGFERCKNSLNKAVFPREELLRRGIEIFSLYSGLSIELIEEKGYSVVGVYPCRPGSPFLLYKGIGKKAVDESLFTTSISARF